MGNEIKGPTIKGSAGQGPTTKRKHTKIQLGRHALLDLCKLIDENPDLVQRVQIDVAHDGATIVTVTRYVDAGKWQEEVACTLSGNYTGGEMAEAQRDEGADDEHGM